MKLPDRVKVGPFEYTVKHLPFYQVDGMLGHSVRHHLELAIANDAPEQHQVVTFIHEVLHAVSDVYQVELDENEVERMANGLVDALQSIDWLPNGAVEKEPFWNVPPPGVYPYTGPNFVEPPVMPPLIPTDQPNSNIIFRSYPAYSTNSNYPPGESIR